jgi:hypothetical protein
MSNIVPLADIQQMAEVAASSKMFGFKNPQEAMAIMLLCQAESLHPAVAMRDYHVIQGRPALKADAMLARFQQAGGSVNWKEYTNDKVTGLFSHPSGGALEVSWSLAQAKTIGIANKDNWKNYPRAMLRARVISEGIRSVYPGCVVGVYTPEEVQDFDSPRPQAPKDMGMAERVEPVSATEIPQSIEEADGAYKLYLPNTEAPHSAFHTKEEWVAGYANMIARIYKSTKFDDAGKAQKIDGLKACNMDMLESLDSFQKIKIKALLAEAGVSTNPKSEPPPSPAQEVSEPIF